MIVQAALPNSTTLPHVAAAFEAMSELQDRARARSAAASLGEPAERPTPTSPDLCRACGCVLDPAYARIFTFCDDCFAEKHPASPSVSGSVRDETPGKLSREDAAQFDATVLAGCVPHSPSSARVSEDAPGDERQEEADTPERDAWRRLTEAVVAAEGLVNAHVESTDAPESLWRAATWLSKAMECLPDVRPSAAELTALRAERDRLLDGLLLYATHHADCFCWPRAAAVCTCGLDAILKSLSSSPSTATLEKP